MKFASKEVIKERLDNVGKKIGKIGSKLKEAGKNIANNLEKQRQEQPLRNNLKILELKQQIQIAELKNKLETLHHRTKPKFDDMFKF